MSRSKRQTRSGLAALAALGLSLLIGGCRPESSLTSSTVLSASDTAGFTPMALSEAQAEMAQSGIRVEVRIRPGSSPLVATELALGPASMAGEPEQVQANITAIAAEDVGGSLTSDLGGLTITFDDNTVFSREDGDATLTRDEFVAAVNSGMSAGRRIHFAARRTPPESPQAPDDGSFLADRIHIGGDSEVLRIDLNAGPANLQLNANPPPDAFLGLLGLTIEIRISDGTTRIGKRHDHPGQRIEFGGQVTSVRLERSVFVLASGLIVRVTDQTVIIENDGIATLADVAAALGAGALVKAEGVGTVASTNPKVLNALRVRFAKHRPVFAFRDYVKAVDPDARKLTLANGAVLCFDDASVISEDGDLTSLEQVARARAAGRRVAAAGVARPNQNATTDAASSTGCRATVIKVRFTLVPPPLFEFRDGVESVDLDARTLTLASGAVLCFNEHSVIGEDGDLTSLEQVARALAANLRVAAAGVATPNVTPTTSNVQVCRATVIKVRFTLVPPPVLEFRDGVTAVDVEGGRITLAVGAVLCFDDHSVISQEDDLNSLAEVARALEAGLRVGAAGSATPGPYEKECRATVLRVRFSLVNDG